jgi:multiple sugar transport system substrate-binding protein
MHHGNFVDRFCAPVAKAIGLALMAATLATSAASAADPAILKIWTRSGTDARAAWDALTAKFTERSGLKVELFSATTDFEQRLARALSSGDLPDVIINDSSTLGQFVTLGVASEIDRATLVNGKDVSDRAWQGARAFDGKYYAVPFSVHPFVLFIRSDWRAKLGLPVPKTWADLQALSKAFAEKDPDGNGKADTYGLIILGTVTRGYASWYLSTYLWQAGGDFIREAGDSKYRATLTEPQAATAVKYVRDFVCVDKSAQPGAINAAPFDAVAGFRSGQAGIYLTGPWNIPVFDKEPGRDKYEVVQVPAGPANGDVLAEGDLAYIVKSSTNKAAAKAFVEFLVSPEGQTLAMNPGGSPLVRIAANSKVNAGDVFKDPRWDTVNEAYAKHGHYMPNVPNWSAIRQLTAEGINKMMASCDEDIPAGLKDLNTRLERELAKQKVLAN